MHGLEESDFPWPLMRAVIIDLDFPSANVPQFNEPVPIPGKLGHSFLLFFLFPFFN